MRRKHGKSVMKHNIAQTNRKKDINKLSLCILLQM